MIEQPPDQEHLSIDVSATARQAGFEFRMNISGDVWRVCLASQQQDCEPENDLLGFIVFMGCKTARRALAHGIHSFCFTVYRAERTSLAPQIVPLRLRGEMLDNGQHSPGIFVTADHAR